MVWVSKDQDESMIALHDCNGDVNRAINVLLEGSPDTDSWEMVGKKKGVSGQKEISQAETSEEGKENREKGGEKDAARRRGGPPRKGRGASRGRECNSPLFSVFPRTFNPADYAEPAQTEENYGGGSTWNNTGSVELEEGAGLEYSTGEGPNYPPKFDSGPGQRAASFLLRLLIFLLTATNDILATCGAAACFRSSQNGCRSLSRSAGLPEFLGCPGFQRWQLKCLAQQTFQALTFSLERCSLGQNQFSKSTSPPLPQQHRATKFRTVSTQVPAVGSSSVQLQPNGDVRPESISNTPLPSISLILSSEGYAAQAVPSSSVPPSSSSMAAAQVSLGAPQAPSVGPATVSTPSGQGPVSSLAMGLNAASMGPPPTAPTSILVSSTSSTIPSPATSSTRSSVASSG
ncbi:hypothetical protein GOODEAATRI_015053 [Goodea atripinnis]|uniref:UBA domain-containing protein n=1 Tax=Goodea atripinnis TaxID=208336 RepID=A0ABV0NUN4_9TELE